MSNYPYEHQTAGVSTDTKIFRKPSPNYVHPQERVAKECNEKLVDAIDLMMSTLVDELAKIREAINVLGGVNTSDPGVFTSLDIKELLTPKPKSLCGLRTTSVIEDKLELTSIKYPPMIDDVLTAEERKESLKETKPAVLNPVDLLNLRFRSARILRENKISYLWELIDYTPSQLLKFQHFGYGCLFEINTALSYLGLSLKSGDKPHMYASIPEETEEE